MKLTPEILEKYYQGLCSEEESQIVENWLDQDEGEESSYFDNKDQIDTWNNLQNKIDTKKKIFNLLNSKRILKYAAIFIGLLLLSSIIYFFLYPNHQESTLVETERISMDTITTYAKERNQLTLSDGTEVLLNFNSKISFPKKFGTNTRTVYLSGEAFFKVKKDPRHPFIIHIQNKAIKVLGTQFTIDGYHAPHTISVTVKEGKVKFYSLQDTLNAVTLTKGQRGEYVDNIGFEKIQTNNAFWLSWMNEAPIVYTNNSLIDITSSLSQKFGVDFKIKTDFQRRHFTGNFKGNSPVESIIQQICFVLNCNYTVDKNEIRIY